MINIAVLGYGTVGSGVVEIARTNQDIINKNIGEDLTIKYVLDLKDFPSDPVQEILIHDYETILKDPDIAVVVEVMGGIEPAYTYTKKALLSGKSVCTSNKALVAEHGAELISIAREHRVNYLFEASCGGGIPIVRPLRSSLTADDIDEIIGILNGTTNYILTEMKNKGTDFDTVLKDAQAKGYAEADPEADVEGHDACRKIAILSSLAYGHTVDYKDIYTEGITAITSEDMEYADACGMKIKLLATSRKTSEGVFAFVSPVMIGDSTPLYIVDGVMNSIFVHGNVLGDAMFYGSGAGKLPTASAVMSDVVDCAKHLGKPVHITWRDGKIDLISQKDIKSTFFVRAKSSARDTIKKLFGEHEEIHVSGKDDEFGIFTDEMTEGAFEDARANCKDIISRIRVFR